jgi:hypothetical protein
MAERAGAGCTWRWAAAGAVLLLAGGCATAHEAASGRMPGAAVADPFHGPEVVARWTTPT